MATTLQPIKPCWHMKTIISALVDNKVTGVIKSYALWHIRHCPRCQAALNALRDLHARLHNLASKPAVDAPAGLSDERRSRLEAAWDRVEEERT